MQIFENINGHNHTVYIFNTNGSYIIQVVKDGKMIDSATAVDAATASMMVEILTGSKGVQVTI